MEASTNPWVLPFEEVFLALFPLSFLAQADFFLVCSGENRGNAQIYIVELIPVDVSITNWWSVRCPGHLRSVLLRDFRSLLGYR